MRLIHQYALIGQNHYSIKNLIIHVGKTLDIVKVNKFTQ